MEVLSIPCVMIMDVAVYSKMIIKYNIQMNLNLILRKFEVV